MNENFVLPLLHPLKNMTYLDFYSTEEVHISTLDVLPLLYYPTTVSENFSSP